MTKRSKILFGGLIGLPLICGLTGFLITSKQEREIAEEIAKLQAMGVPTTAKELKAATKRKGENAAPYYRSAMGKMKKPGVEPLVDALGAFNPSGGAASVALFQPNLAAFEPIFRDLLLASQCPSLDFGKDYDKIMWIEFDEFSPMKNLARASAVRASVCAGDGDWKGAIEALRVADRVAHHVGQEPSVISVLVGIAIRSIHDRRLQHVIGRFQNDPKALAALQAHVASLDPLPDQRISLMGETMFAMQVLDHGSFRDEFSANDFDDSSDWKYSVMKLPPVRRAVRLHLIRGWREIWEGMPSDGQDWRSVEAILRKAEMKSVSDGSMVGTISSDFFPVFGIAPAWARCLAQRRLAQSTIKLLQERQKGGSLPAKLPDYGLNSTDPFTGKPLHYRKTASGFVIYSEDSNGDQGGVGKGYRGDIVWEIG